MADLAFNTPGGAVVERALLIAYLNTGTPAAPVWSPIGKRVEDSSEEFDWSDESKTDIFGNTYTTMKKPTITQTFDPCELDSSDAAQVKIWNLAVKDQDAAALASQDLLIVHAYAGTSPAAMFAERYSACAVKPTGLGGSSNVAMPIEITYGGTRTVGTASISNGVVTFTPATGAEYLVTFSVTGAGGARLAGAKIYINNQMLTTDANGIASIQLPAGTYEYSVIADGYTTVTDEIAISSAAVFEAVALNA